MNPGGLGGVAEATFLTSGSTHENRRMVHSHRLRSRPSVLAFRVRSADRRDPELVRPAVLDAAGGGARYGTPGAGHEPGSTPLCRHRALPSVRLARRLG